MTAGIPEEVTATYADSFHINRMITELTLPNITKETIKQLGISTTIIGDIMTIQRHVSEIIPPEPLQQQEIHTPTSQQLPERLKCPPPTCPFFKQNTTNTKWRKFINDWSNFKKLSFMEPDAIILHLYGTCEENYRPPSYPQFQTTNY